MEKQEILKRLDHTLLQQTAVWEQIKVLCDEGMEYGTASVCIPPSFVKRAKEYVGRQTGCLHGYRLSKRLYDYGCEGF